MWLLFALAGPVFWAASTHIDKFLVDRYFRDSDTAVLMVFTALIGVVMLPFIALFAPQALSQDAASAAVMAGCGCLTMGAMLFYLRAIQSEEASVVAPLFQTATIFTLLLAYLLLGEVPGWRRIAGMALIVAAVVSLTLHPGGGGHSIRGRTLALMMAATFVIALSGVLFKYFAVRSDFWSTIFWTFVGEAAFGAGIIAIPAYRRQFTTLLRTNTAALLSVNAANELINLGGGLGVRFASLLAPIAVVSAISSTTTLFVFGFGALLSRFAPTIAQEDLSLGNLLRKGAAAAVAAAGVGLAS
jgi:drug/metabolite transporter (DMT)-like permease